jgi:hypothetical protein
VLAFNRALTDIFDVETTIYFPDATFTRRAIPIGEILTPNPTPMAVL